MKGGTLKKDREVVDLWKYDRFTITEKKQEIQRIGTIAKKETNKQVNKLTRNEKNKIKHRETESQGIVSIIDRVLHVFLVSN